MMMTMMLAMMKLIMIKMIEGNVRVVVVVDDDSDGDGESDVVVDDDADNLQIVEPTAVSLY